MRRVLRLMEGVLGLLEGEGALIYGRPVVFSKTAYYSVDTSGIAGPLPVVLGLTPEEQVLIKNNRATVVFKLGDRYYQAIQVSSWFREALLKRRQDIQAARSVDPDAEPLNSPEEAAKDLFEVVMEDVIPRLEFEGWEGDLQDEDTARVDGVNSTITFELHFKPRYRIVGLYRIKGSRKADKKFVKVDFKKSLDAKAISKLLMTAYRELGAKATNF